AEGVRWSCGSLVESNASPLCRGLETGLGESDTPHPGPQVVGVRIVGDDVADELLPLRLECVLEHLVGGYVEPLGAEVGGFDEIRIPDRLGCRLAGLDATTVQTGDRRSEGAVDL